MQKVLDRVSVSWCDRPKLKKTRARTFQVEHRDLISLSVKHGQQGADWGISEPCEKCHWSSRSSFFFFLSVMAVAGEQSRAQKSPSSASDPGDRRNHIISAVTQSHCQGVVEESARRLLVWCWKPRNTSVASSQPLARTKPQFEQVRHISQWFKVEKHLSHLVCTYKTPVS